mgnify:CR=1 FL=1
MCGVILISPAVSVELTVLPFNVRLSTFQTSTLLLESTIAAHEAVTVFNSQICDRLILICGSGNGINKRNQSVF